MIDVESTRNAVKITKKLWESAKEALSKNPSNINLKIDEKQKRNNYDYAVKILLEKTESNSEQLRETALSVAIKEIGQRELTGHNDGLVIQKYQEHAEWLKGQAWCMSFVTWCFLQSALKYKIERPFPQHYRVNSFVDLARQKGWVIDRKTIPFEGDLFVKYDKNNPENSHIGFVRENKENLIITVEGNYQNQVYSRSNLSKALIDAYIRVKIN